jgi:hypothetical protein
MPLSIWPSAIFMPTMIAVSRLVPQARCRSNAGVSGASPLDSTASRVRLKSRGCFSTAPAPTSPRRSPASRYLSTTPFSAAVSMSWLLQSA